VSVDALWIIATCTPSSSIRPLVKVPTFWNAIDGRRIFASFAVSFSAPTYFDPAGIAPAELPSFAIVSVPDALVMLAHC